MAPPAQNRTNAPILPPSTPSNNTNARPSPAHLMTGNQHGRDTPNNSTPSSESRMNPPVLPRSLMTPARDAREGSTVSSGGSSTRKPRQNLDERDHIMMLKHCYEHRDTYKEGTKAQFWTGVNESFQEESGKALAQMSATVGRLIEGRRRQIADWEQGVIPQKSGGELNDRLDQWMDFLKNEDGAAEEERMRQVDARRKVEEARKDARRQALAAETIVSPGVRMPGRPQSAVPLPHQPPPGQELVAYANGETEINGNRPIKRRRRNSQHAPNEVQTQPQVWQGQAPQYGMQQTTRRVVVEGQMTKEDWREVMGNDARLRALENKVDKIELLVSQNNKLLLQLVQNKDRDRDRNEEERVPVHLDAEFERDYL